MDIQPVDDDNYRCYLDGRPFVVNRHTHRQLFLAITIAVLECGGRHGCTQPVAATIAGAPLCAEHAQLVTPTLDAAANRLRAFVREHYAGKCKALTFGALCECLLCDVDRLITAALHHAETPG